MFTSTFGAVPEDHAERLEAFERAQREILGWDQVSNERQTPEQPDHECCPNPNTYREKVGAFIKTHPKTVNATVFVLSFVAGYVGMTLVLKGAKALTTAVATEVLEGAQQVHDQLAA